MGFQYDFIWLSIICIICIEIMHCIVTYLIVSNDCVTPINPIQEIQTMERLQDINSTHYINPIHSLSNSRNLTSIQKRMNIQNKEIRPKLKSF